MNTKFCLGKKSPEKNGCVRPRAQICQSVFSVGHGMDNRGNVVRFLEVQIYSSFLQRVQTASGAHRGPYSVPTRSASPRVKATNE